jgi:Fe-S cluster assembly ATP-binding protein
MALLDIRDLGFTAGGRDILRGLSLTVEGGEIHALLGANGAGKSTLAYAIMGCAGYAPTAGEIRFAGHPLEGVPMHERARRGITLAWQEPARFEGLPVRTYLSLGCATGEPTEQLRRVGLAPADYLDRNLDEHLSGGERKRIELAAVLGLAPRLAVLDEPGAGIDLLSVADIGAVIQGLARDGAGVLLITHRAEMADIANRASYLCGGCIVASGTPEAIAARYRARRCSRCDGERCR